MKEVSPKRNLLVLWLKWHFFDAPGSILFAFRNFIVFAWKYFSVSLLLRTFFSHWKHYRESYGRGFDLKRYFSAFWGNMVSRMVGMVIRFFTLLTWLIFEILIIVSGMVVVALWVFSPTILAILILSARSLL